MATRAWPRIRRFGGLYVCTVGSRLCELCGMRDLYIARMECGKEGRILCLYCARMRSCVLTTISRVWHEYLTWPSTNMPSYVDDVCPSVAWSNMCDYLVGPRSSVARNVRVQLLAVILVGLPTNLRSPHTFARFGMKFLRDGNGTVLDLIIAYVEKSPLGDFMLDENPGIACATLLAVARLRCTKLVSKDPYLIYHCFGRID